LLNIFPSWLAQSMSEIMSLPYANLQEPKLYVHHSRVEVLFSQTIHYTRHPLCGRNVLGRAAYDCSKSTQRAGRRQRSQQESEATPDSALVQDLKYSLCRLAPPLRVEDCRPSLPVSNLIATTLVRSTLPPVFPTTVAQL
jgi:hypothetical protein